MRRVALLFCLVATLHLDAQGQQNVPGIKGDKGPYYQKDISLLAGYMQGIYGFAEAGLSYNIYGDNHGNPFGFNCFIAGEAKLGNKFVAGPKAGAWITAGGAAIGTSLIYYTDFNKSCIVFRPEAGLGLGKLKLTYAYNWNFTKTFGGINKQMIGLTYCIGLKNGDAKRHN